MHGLHRVSHLVCADGSGRDSSIFTDGMFQKGRIYGCGNASAIHPLFKTREVGRILSDDAEFTDVFGIKPHKGVNLQVAAKRSLQAGSPADWNQACFRTKGGHVLMLPKEARADPALPALRLQPLMASRKKSLVRSTSAQNFRSRDTCLSYDHWGTKHPSSVDLQRSLASRKDTAQNAAATHFPGRGY